MGTWPKRINRSAQARKLWVNFIYAGKDCHFLLFLHKLKVISRTLMFESQHEMQNACWEHNRSLNRDERRRNERDKSYVFPPKSIKPTKHRKF